MAELPPGTRLGRYVIETPLGRGGMGQVYRAHDELLRRRVAIKVLTSNPRVTAGARRILREARMAAALHHPNIVALFDFGEQAATPYIVMELVEGSSLRELIDGDADFEERLRWLIDVARALAAAHEKGLVHRDIKPENVMVGEDGVVKVLDFGIARHDESARAGVPFELEATADATPDATLSAKESQVAGTIGYMAPELVTTGTSGPAADQFAWGVVACEVLTGKLPWRSAKAGEILRSVAFAEQLTLGASRDDLPPAVAAVIERALAFDPAKRFSSMPDLLSALNVIPSAATSNRRRSTADAPDQATTVPIDSSRVGEADTQTIAALSFAPTVGVPLSQSHGSVPGETSPAADTGAQRRRVAPWAVAIGVVLAGAGATTWAVIQSHRGTTTPRVAASEPRAELPPSFVFELSNERRLTRSTGCEEFPSITPDNRTVILDATDGADSHVYAVDIATGERRPITSGHGWQYAPSLSPDGREIAYLSAVGGETSAYAVPVDGSTAPRFIAKGEIRPRFALNGAGIWAGDDVPTRYDSTTFLKNATLGLPVGFEAELVLELEDGRLAVLVRQQGNQGALLLYPSAHAEPIEPSWLLRGQLEETLTLSPSGRVLFAYQVFGGEDTLAAVPIDGSPTLHPATRIAPTKGLSISGTHDRVAWSTCSARSALGMLVSGTNGLRSVPMGAPDANLDGSSPAWIPHTRSVVVQSSRGDMGDEVWVEDLDGRQSARTLPVPTGITPVDPAVSPGADSVAFSSSAGIFVVALDGNSEARKLTSGASDRGPQFSADGRDILFTSAGPDAVPHIDKVPVGGGPIVQIVAAPSRAPRPLPDGERVLYLSGKDEARAMLLDLKTGKARELPFDVGSATNIATSPDGMRAAIWGISTLTEVDLATLEERGAYDTGTKLMRGATYVDRDLVIAEAGWIGYAWIADGRFQ